MWRQAKNEKLIPDFLYFYASGFLKNTPPIFCVWSPIHYNETSNPPYAPFSDRCANANGENDNHSRALSSKRKIISLAGCTRTSETPTAGMIGRWELARLLEIMRNSLKYLLTISTVMIE